MKNKLATLVVLIFCSVASANVTVSGNGKITYVPDIGHVNVGVTSEGKTAADAWNANAKIVKKLFEALKKFGIDPKDIKTSGLNISPKYIYTNGSPPELVGYTATYNLDVVVRKLPELGQVLDAMVANGANRGMNIGFSSSKLDQLMDEARTQAAKDARRKAELYVTGAGGKVGALVSVSEFQPSYPRPMYYERLAKGAADLPIAAGQQELAVNVTVVYEIERARSKWLAE